MANGDVQRVARKRKAPSDERVAGRVAAFCACDEASAPEGAQPLNPGFFQLERMRARTAAKLRAKQRGKVRGK